MTSDPRTSEEPRRVGRPPYGLPMRDRRRSTALSDSLSWRRYATPTPPGPRGRRLRLPRAVIVAGLLGCISAGVWSISWQANGSSPQKATAAMPTAEAPVTTPTPSPTSPPSSAPPRTPPPSAKAKARPRPPKAAKQDRKHRRRAAPAVRRPLPPPVRSRGGQQHRVHRPKRAEARRHVHRAPRRLSMFGNRCDQMFPPSRPEQRIRNRACHVLLG